MSQARKIKRAAQEKDDPNKVIITTSRGVRLECHPIITEIEAQEENIRAQFEWPEVPHRDISHTVPPDAGPDWPRTKELTQSYVDGEHVSDEDKETWTEYTEATAKVDAEYTAKLNDARLRLLVLRGVTVLDERPEAEWIEEHEWMGMVVPENPLERRLHYFRTDVLGAMSDTLEIMKGIYRTAGVDEEVLDEFEQSFRDQMGRTIREALGSDQGDAGAEEQDEE